MNVIFILLSLIIGLALAEYTPTVLKIDKNLVLSSVYDAIRENGDRLSRIDLGDGRNKRNINYYGYEDYKSDEFIPSFGEVVHAIPMKQPQCKSDNPALQSISISDHNWSSAGSSVVQFLKHLMLILAVIALPILLLQAFLLPLKVLMGLKSIALANSVLLGSFLWKYLVRANVVDREDALDDDSSDLKGGPNEVDDRFYYPFKSEDLENLNESEIKAILKFIKMKNKKW